MPRTPDLAGDSHRILLVYRHALWQLPPKGDGDSRTRSPAVAESPGRRTRRRLQRPTCSRFLLRCETPLSCRPDRTGTLPLDRQCERTQWRYQYTLYDAWKPASAANTTGPALTCEAMADTDTLRFAMNLHTQLTAVAGGSSLLRLERVVRSRPLTLDSCPEPERRQGPWLRPRIAPATQACQ